MNLHKKKPAFGIYRKQASLMFFFLTSNQKRKSAEGEIQ